MPRLQLASHIHTLYQIATGRVQVVDAGGDGPRSRAWWEILGILTTTLTVLAAGIFVMLSGEFDESAKKWASGVVGAAVGYWLK